MAITRTHALCPDGLGSFFSSRPLVRCFEEVIPIHLSSCWF